jgi:hypothetical protein
MSVQYQGFITKKLVAAKKLRIKKLKCHHHHRRHHHHYQQQQYHRKLYQMRN